MFVSGALTLLAAELEHESRCARPLKASSRTTITTTPTRARSWPWRATASWKRCECRSQKVWRAVSRTRSAFAAALMCLVMYVVGNRATSGALDRLRRFRFFDQRNNWHASNRTAKVWLVDCFVTQCSRVVSRVLLHHCAADLVGGLQLSHSLTNICW